MWYKVYVMLLKAGEVPIFDAASGASATKSTRGAAVVLNSPTYFDEKNKVFYVKNLSNSVKVGMGNKLLAVTWCKKLREN